LNTDLYLYYFLNAPIRIQLGAWFDALKGPPPSTTVSKNRIEPETGFVDVKTDRNRPRGKKPPPTQAYSNRCTYVIMAHYHNIFKCWQLKARAAVRLKISIAINRTIKIFNRDQLQQNKKHKFVAQNSSIIHDITSIARCKSTTVHFTSHKQQCTTSCDVTILCVCELLCDGRSRHN